MGAMMELKKIGTIHTDFKDKFGIPRQSGLVPELTATITMEPEYRSLDAFRGIEGYSHLWLLWEFSEAVGKEKSLTVRPPRLGGNKRMGVFATRSPFRPNSIGLSCVKFVSLEWKDGTGPVLTVAGADLLDKTPIYDIKPYLPYVDAKVDAVGGFSEEFTEYHLEVEIEKSIAGKLEEGKLDALKKVLAQDPRPSYQDDPERIYGMTFAGHEIRFSVAEGRLTVFSITE